MVALQHYPMLKRFAWNRRPDAVIRDEVALELYERNWLSVDVKKLIPEERTLIDHLVATVGHGVLHV